MIINPKLVRELESLTSKEINRNVSYAFEHELLWYGVDAVVHYHVMDRVKDVTAETLPEFAQKYKLGRGTQFWNEHHIAISADTLEQDGIYIPKQRRGGIVALFENDYFANRGFNGTFDRDNFMKLGQLKKRSWENSTLLDKEIQERGLQWSKELWMDCVAGFKKYKNGGGDIPKQSEKVTRLGEELIAYYSAMFMGAAK